MAKNTACSFQRQKTIGNYIVDFYCHKVDFYCHKAKLVVEIYVGQHYTEEGLAYDYERTAVLNNPGLRVIRFNNIEVDKRNYGDTVIGQCEMWADG